MLSQLIFLKNLSTWEYMLTVRIMVYLIPVTLHPHLYPPNLLISLLPAPQLDVTRTIWRGLKPKKQGTRRKKKIKQEKLEGKSLMISCTLSIYSASKWRQTLEMGLGDIPSPLPFISAWQKIHYLYVFVWSWINKLNSVADTSNVCTEEIGKEAP